MPAAIADPFPQSAEFAGPVGDGSRVLALDLFRGLVILTMVFVNFLAGVDGMPGWAKHMPGTLDGFTLVDLVFPGFLFSVGVAIPLAVQQRRRRGDSLGPLLRHIALRSAALLFLGVILVNRGAYSPEATGMSEDLWYLLALLAITVLWGAPRLHEAGPRSMTLLGLRVLAALLLGYLLVIFRGKSAAGETVWLRHSWWGILGLIGWAYLNCSLVYLVARGQPTALMGWLGFLIALYIGGRHGSLDWLGPINQFVGVGAVLGSTSANVMAGVLVGTQLAGPTAVGGPTKRYLFQGAFGLGLYLSGMLLRPLHGIVKNQATESYTLVAAGICCGVFLLCEWVSETGPAARWLSFLLPAGRNPLLAYLLPDLLMSLAGAVGLTRLLWPSQTGLAGAINAAVLTVVVLLLNWVLTRAGLRLRL